MMMLLCTKCGEEKSEESFSKKKESKTGYRSTCKKCHADYMRNVWYPKNAERHKKSVGNYKKKNPHKVKAAAHKIDENEVKELLENTNECEICGQSDNLCVDHCHKTNKLRGMLCRQCNLALGNLGDDENLILEKIVKIEKYVKRFVDKLSKNICN